MGHQSFGQVVGYATDDTDQIWNSHAVLWQGGTMIDLASLVPAGWAPDDAKAINDAGQIAGHANGHAVLLTPVQDLTINNVSVTEGHTRHRPATFTVTLSAASTQTVTVAYATGNGTATAGSDYQAASGTLTFAPGETSKTITVLVNGDRLAEPNETFVVNLSSATNATIADGQGVGTIVDDEPRISISDVTQAEGQEEPNDAVHLHGHALGRLRSAGDDVVPHRGRHRQDQRPATTSPRPAR